MIGVLMGVTGSGKTTIGKALAAQLQWQYAEGDDYHSEANRQKMHAGIPLTDADRGPWLNALHDVLLEWHRERTDGVLACSALRQQYRDLLSAGIPDAEICFVLLEVPKDVLEQRLALRKKHYMNPALLDSQIATLETPRSALRISGVEPPAKVVASILQAMGLKDGDG